jgi:hypothetical protein
VVKANALEVVHKISSANGVTDADDSFPNVIEVMGTSDTSVPFVREFAVD